MEWITTLEGKMHDDEQQVKRASFKKNGNLSHEASYYMYELTLTC